MRGTSPPAVTGQEPSSVSPAVTVTVPTCAPSLTGASSSSGSSRAVSYTHLSPAVYVVAAAAAGIALKRPEGGR